MSKTQFFKSHIFQEPTYYLDSEHLSDDIEFIEKNNVFSLGVNPHKGYKLKDINTLLPIKERIKRLSIECRKMNLDIISEFKNLEYLYIIEDNDNFDLKGLSKLKMLNLSYNSSIQGLEDLINIENLVISNVNKVFFDKIIPNYKQLKRLKINASKIQEDLSFIEELSKISILEFVYCRSLVDVSKLNCLAKSLKVLRIENCKKVTNIESLEVLVNLEELYLIDSVAMKDIDPLSKLNKLKSLVVMGTSYFVDGNLSKLLVHNSLKHVGIDNKRHYSHKYEEIKKILEK